jgi:ribosome-binding protein aMBF1 (putative translation factor)
MAPPGFGARDRRGCTKIGASAATGNVCRSIVSARRRDSAPNADSALRSIGPGGALRATQINLLRQARSCDRRGDAPLSGAGFMEDIWCPGDEKPTRVPGTYQPTGMVQSCCFTIDAGMQTVLNVAQEIHLLYHLRNTTRRDAVDSQMLDVGLHERRRARRMQDPDFRESYDRASREITQTDAVIRALDSLRAELGISKAELARRVNRNASSVRRLFTADQARPELPLIIAIADALDAEVCIVPRQAEARSAARSPGRRRRVPTAI